MGLYETFKEIEREQAEKRYNSRENRIKTSQRINEYIIRPTKNKIKTGTNYIGPNGVIGGLVGYCLLGGPLGLIAGAVAGKNYKKTIEYGKKTSRGMINGAMGGLEIISNSEKYKEINPTATHQKKEPQLRGYPNKGDYKGSKTKEAEYLTKKEFIRVLNGIERSKKRILNSYNYLESSLKNNAEYKRLEKIAEELSEKKGTKITPKEAYKIIKDEEIKKIKLKRLKDLGTIIITLEDNFYKMGQTPGKTEQDYFDVILNRDKYVEEYNQLLRDLEEWNPSQYQKKWSEELLRSYKQRNENSEENRDSENKNKKKGVKK